MKEWLDTNLNLELNVAEGMKLNLKVSKLSLTISVIWLPKLDGSMNFHIGD